MPQWNKTFLASGWCLWTSRPQKWTINYPATNGLRQSSKLKVEPKTTCWLRVQAALSENPGLASGIHTGHLTTTCNFRPDTLFLASMHSRTHPHPDTHGHTRFRIIFNGKTGEMAQQFRVCTALPEHPSLSGSLQLPVTLAPRGSYYASASHGTYNILTRAHTHAQFKTKSTPHTHNIPYSPPAQWRQMATLALNFYSSVCLCLQSSRLNVCA